MKQNPLLKLFLLGFLTLIMAVPLLLVWRVVDDRQQYQHEVQHFVAQSWGNEQTLAGPWLVLPYTERYLEQVGHQENQRFIMQERVVKKTLRIMPNRLEMLGTLNVSERRRGVYRIPVYGGTLTFKGHFDGATARELIKGANSEDRALQHDRLTSVDNRLILDASIEIDWQHARIGFYVADPHGIVSRPLLAWQGQELPFVEGSQESSWQQGMHVILPPFDQNDTHAMEFQFALDIQGSSAFSVIPLSDETLVSLQTDWPHPSFIGRYLPSQNTISAAGFSASWTVTSFSSDIEQFFADGYVDRNVNAFGVKLIEPIDIYAQTERSLKYGILFVALTFIAFFLFEVRKRLSIHPIQYLLVGFALAMFYLLLLSLSEHLDFARSYIVSSLAIVVLLGLYLTAVLRSRRLGFGFSSGLASVYGALFLIIRSEDNALLMGSLLLFVMLSMVMLSTRHLDWYALAAKKAIEPALDDTQDEAKVDKNAVSS